VTERKIQGLDEIVKKRTTTKLEKRDL